VKAPDNPVNLFRFGEGYRLFDDIHDPGMTAFPIFFIFSSKALGFWATSTRTFLWMPSLCAVMRKEMPCCPR